MMRQQQQQHNSNYLITGNNKNNNNVFGTIDLHGYNREDAIRQVTIFLENVCKKKKTSNSNGPLWVEIITGSGSHSSGTGGPILRGAVEKLLIKRHMDYQLVIPGKSSFIVNANSGIVLTAEYQKTTTKLNIIEKDHNCNDIKLVGRIQPTSSTSTSTSTTTSSSSSDDTDNSNRINNNSCTLSSLLPSDIAHDDKLIEQIKRTSIKEYQTNKNQRNNEDKEYKKLLKESKEDYEHNKKREQIDEEVLKQIMEQSIIEQKQKHNDNANDNDEEEERLLQEAIKESEQLEIQRKQSLSSCTAALLSDDEINNDIEKAIQESLLQNNNNNNNNNNNETEKEQDDEEDMIRKAIELSLVDK